MDNVFVVSLVISGMGMLLLFLALVALYGLMSLMTRVFRDPAVVPVQARPEEQREPGEKDAATRAAVIAVALARAREEPRPVGTPVGGEGTGPQSPCLEVSPWWALHHDRQLTRKPNTPRSR